MVRLDLKRELRSRYGYASLEKLSLGVVGA